jgi:hypothetical protein
LLVNAFLSPSVVQQHASIQVHGWTASVFSAAVFHISVCWKMSRHRTKFSRHGDFIFRIWAPLTRRPFPSIHFPFAVHLSPKTHDILPATTRVLKKAQILHNVWVHKAWVLLYIWTHYVHYIRLYGHVLQRTVHAWSSIIQNPGFCVEAHYNQELVRLSFYVHSHNCEKLPLASSCLSVCPPMEQFGSHRMDFHEI